MRHLFVALCGLSLFSVACKSTESAEEKQTPLSAVTEAVDAGVVAEKAPPPEPKVELPPNPALPTRPALFPDVHAPDDNATTPDRVALGHELFFDKRLSKDGSMACVQCHLPEKAWTSGNALDAKVGGAVNKRNSPSVVNLGAHHAFYWDGRMPTMEAVCNAAWKGQLGADPAAIASTLAADPVTKAKFMRAYGQPPNADNIPKAFAAFLRTLEHGNAPFDAFEAGDKKAISADAQKGWELFKNKGCTLCHAPPLFTDFQFHNVGVQYQKPEAERDPGHKDATKDDADFGKFRTPGLRGVELTAPYFHDGSVASLAEAIDYMAAGFNAHPKLDEKLKKQKLSKQEKAQLEAFLKSLTGKSTFTGAP